MTDTLLQICADKLKHIASCKAKIPEAELRQKAGQQSPTRGFKNAIIKRIVGGKPALISEIKKASPSKGLIRADFDAKKLAIAYENGGATCLSVLTDIPYFQGTDEYLVQAREAVSLPVLRKDFMLDTYQITEARALGADAILLIMAALSDNQAIELESYATELGMDILVEVHNLEELERAISINPTNKNKIFGINNRNLKTLEVSLNTSQNLAKYLPKGSIGVCESGIKTHTDIALMQSFGLNCFLVGESLMKQADVTLATKELLGI